ncbi:glycosyltransferase family 4 protein [Pontibacter populi]|uniref:Glycosyltransferase family 4 protein n=1 Tax=Pontibacter populi TaxID=890055 RepID=A0ABV1RY73_9BACT
MKVSYITTHDAQDIHNWSGLSYFISQALCDQGATIEYINNLKTRNTAEAALKSLYYRIIRGEKYIKKRNPTVAKSYAMQAVKQISDDSQFIFSPGSLPLALINSEKPIIFYTDATFAGMLDFYADFSNLCKATIKEGHYLEQSALDKCTLALYASDWAAKSAISNYKVDPGKVRVVPFGANISHSKNADDIRDIIKARSKTTCRLLFMGVNWIRKGGDMALKVADQLNKKGIKTELHVVGLKTIPIRYIPHYVINHGFISKSTEEGRYEIEKLLTICNFLIVPSVAEAYGLVFCEASAYGLPSLARDVGGVATIIKNNVNGKTFDLESPADEYAAYIESYFKDYSKYEELAFSSYLEYQKRLNWKISGGSIVNMLKEL